MNLYDTSEASALSMATTAFPSVDDYFAMLKGIMPGIAATLGDHGEVVLHDFRDLDRSIVAIDGKVTGRSVGGSITQLGLMLIAQGDAAEDQINYVTRTPEGRVLRSSTLPLRDQSGQVFGALCINIDVTELRLLARVVSDLAGTAQEAPEAVAFTDDVGQVLEAVMAEEELRLGVSIDRMNRQDRLAIFRALDERGVFSLQRSMPRVADALGISRATAYAYLDEVRNGSSSKAASYRDGRSDGSGSA